MFNSKIIFKQIKNLIIHGDVFSEMHHSKDMT